MNDKTIESRFDAQYPRVGNITHFTFEDPHSEEISIEGRAQLIASSGSVAFNGLSVKDFVFGRWWNPSLR